MNKKKRKEGGEEVAIGREYQHRVTRRTGRVRSADAAHVEISLFVPTGEAGRVTTETWAREKFLAEWERREF